MLKGCNNIDINSYICMQKKKRILNKLTEVMTGKMYSYGDGLK